MLRALHFDSSSKCYFGWPCVMSFRQLVYEICRFTILNSKFQIHYHHSCFKTFCNASSFLNTASKLFGGMDYIFFKVSDIDFCLKNRCLQSIILFKIILSLKKNIQKGIGNFFDFVGQQVCHYRLKNSKFIYMFFRYLV